MNKIIRLGILMPIISLTSMVAISCSDTAPNNTKHTKTPVANKIIDITNLWLPTPTDFTNDIQNSKTKSALQDNWLFEGPINPSNTHLKWFKNQTNNVSKDHYKVSMKNQQYFYNGTPYEIKYTAISPFTFPNGKKTYKKNWTPHKLATSLSSADINYSIKNLKYGKHITNGGIDYIEVNMQDKNVSNLIFFDYDKNDSKIIQLKNAMENNLYFQAVKVKNKWKIKPQYYNIYVIPYGQKYFLRSSPSFERNWITGGYLVTIK